MTTPTEPKLIEIMHLYRCNKCREDTPGRWQDGNGNIIHPEKLIFLIGDTFLIEWQQGKAIEKATGERLANCRGCFQVEVYDNRSLRTINLGTKCSPCSAKKGHVCHSEETNE